MSSWRTPTTRPTHSPKPMRTAPSLSHQALERHLIAVLEEVRVSPLASRRLLAAMADFEQRAEAARRCRSTACRCRSGRPAAGCSRCCCGGRRSAPRSSTSPRRREPRESTCGAMPGIAHLSRSSASPRARCRAPPLVAVGGDRRDRAGAAGSPAGRGGSGLRNGASASGLTTHGDTLVRKFLARNGPSG